MIFLLPALQQVLNGEMASILIMADFLEENCNHLPHVDAYVKKLRAKHVKLGDLIDTVAKFGTPHERSLVRKIVKESLGNTVVKCRTKRKTLRKSWRNQNASGYVHPSLKQAMNKLVKS